MFNLDHNLAQLSTACQRERTDFRAGKTTTSPACVELFRRAFANDHAAWNLIFDEIFAYDIRQYVQVARQAYIAQRGFAPFDIEDAEQETRMSFWRYAPQATTLLASGLLEPIIGYLKKCAKSGVALAARRDQKATLSLEQLPGEEETSGADEAQKHKVSHPTDNNFEKQLIERQALLDELRKLVRADTQPEQAEVVVIECFLNELPPRDLPALHPTLFYKIDDVNTVLQRIRRRAEKQPYFRRLLGDDR